MEHYAQYVIGPAIGLIGVVVSTVAIFRQRAIAHRLDTELKTHEASLRAHVDISVHRARAEIERDLKNHEVRLRVAADFRLKMLDRMLIDVSDFRSKLNAAIGATSLLMHEVAPRGGSERAQALHLAALERFAALSSAGPFMPPELFGPTTDLANKFLECLKDVAEWSNLDSQEARNAQCVQTTARMLEISIYSREIFGGWQAQQFAQFTGQLDEIDAENSKFTR
jgi:hypothetical protein